MDKNRLGSITADEIYEDQRNYVSMSLNIAAVELTLWLNIHHINLPLQTKISTLQFSFTLWTYLFCPYKFCRSCTLREVTCDWFLNLFLEFFIILLKLFSTRLLPVFRCFNVTADFNFSSIVKLYPLPLTKSLHLIVCLFATCPFQFLNVCVLCLFFVQFLIKFLDMRNQINIREKPSSSRLFCVKGPQDYSQS